MVHLKISSSKHHGRIACLGLKCYNGVLLKMQIHNSAIDEVMDMKEELLFFKSVQFTLQATIEYKSFNNDLLISFGI